MIKRYNNTSLAFGIPGILLQIVGRVMSLNLQTQVLGILIAIIGTLLLLVGFAYYAMAKGRNPAWCLMAFFSLIGLIILACLKDLAPEGDVGGRRNRQDRDYDDEDDRPRRRRRHDEDDDDFEDDDRPRKEARAKSSRSDLDDKVIVKPGKNEQIDAALVEDEMLVAKLVEPIVPEDKFVTCSKCGKTLKVPGKLIGKKVKCAGCGEILSA